MADDICVSTDGRTNRDDTTQARLHPFDGTLGVRGWMNLERNQRNRCRLQDIQISLIVRKWVDGNAIRITGQ